MEGEFRLHHGSATTEKAAQAAGRVEAIVGDVVNGNRKAWGRIDVEDIALLVQHARDAAASPDWLSKMAIDALVTRWETAKAERDAAIARAEAAEQRAAAAEAEVVRLRADRAVVTTLAIMALGPETHDVLLCSPVPLLGALRPECLAALPDGAQSEDVAAYVREMCGRMLAEAQPAEVTDG